jgi:hypothetical protein
MITMFKIISLKAMGALALSLTMLLGALMTTPVTSAFAKVKYGPAKDIATDTGRGSSYADRNIDNDGDEMNESSEQPVIVYYTSVYGRGEGKRVIEVVK